MKWTDDELMAHADGELTGERRLAIEAAIREDAALERRWAAIKAQRHLVASAFAGVLDEPVPDRLAGLLAPPATAAAPNGPVISGSVVDLAARRVQRERRLGGWNWAQWGGLAASLALGLVLGWQTAPRQGDVVLSTAGGELLAADRLARALGGQVAHQDVPADGFRIQLSFVDKAGHYCRTFSAERIAGLACFEGAQWTVHLVTAHQEKAASTGGMRQAATALPPAVLDAVDARIDGVALSVPEERSALERGWLR